jgi:hypothetical protein
MTLRKLLAALILLGLTVFVLGAAALTVWAVLHA